VIMKKANQDSPDLQKVADLIDEIQVGMVTTLDVASQSFVSRPMMPLEMDEDGSLWFFTKASSMHGLSLDRVNVAFADVAHSSYVSVSGSGCVVDDRYTVERLWSPMAKPWFPGGVDDPELVLLRIDLDSAEYWDANNSRMIRALAMATSVIAGEPIGLGVNKRITRPHAKLPPSNIA